MKKGNKSKSNQDDEKYITDIEWIIQLMKSIQENRLYGKLTIIFEEGKVRRVLIEESKFPPL